MLVLAPTAISLGIYTAFPETFKLFSLLSLFSPYTLKQPSTLFSSPEQAINHAKVYAKAIMRITDH